MNNELLAEIGEWFGACQAISPTIRQILVSLLNNL